MSKTFRSSLNKTFSGSTKVLKIPETCCRALSCWAVTFSRAWTKDRVTDLNTTKIQRSLFKVPSMPVRGYWDMHPMALHTITFSDTPVYQKHTDSKHSTLCHQIWMLLSWCCKRNQESPETRHRAILTSKFIVNTLCYQIWMLPSWCCK